MAKKDLPISKKDEAEAFKSRFRKLYSKVSKLATDKINNNLDEFGEGALNLGEALNTTAQDLHPHIRILNIMLPIIIYNSDLF